MQYNVAQLLKHLVGERREYEVDGLVYRVDERTQGVPVEGTVEFIRTNDGILGRADVSLETVDECSRCLGEVRTPIKIHFEEEFFPTIDVVTGAPLPAPRDPDAFLIDHNHILDLAPAIREYAVVERPMQPLCRPDCRGLCPDCGADLNLQPCDCATAQADPRWASLSQLARLEK